MLDHQVLKELKEYVESNLEMTLLEKSSIIQADYDIVESQSEILDFIEKHRNPDFKEVLFNFIDRSGATDPEIYKKARIDRRLFSKLRSNPDYHPSKSTIIALALALELNIDETDNLLHAAGFTLSNSDTFDLVIQFCIERKIFNVHDVNLALDQFDLKALI